MRLELSKLAKSSGEIDDASIDKMSNQMSVEELMSTMKSEQEKFRKKVQLSGEKGQYVENGNLSEHGGKSDSEMRLSEDENVSPMKTLGIRHYSIDPVESSLISDRQRKTPTSSSLPTIFHTEDLEADATYPSINNLQLEFPGQTDGQPISQKDELDEEYRIKTQLQSASQYISIEDQGVPSTVKQNLNASSSDENRAPESTLKRQPGQPLKADGFGNRNNRLSLNEDQIVIEFEEADDQPSEPTGKNFSGLRTLQDAQELSPLATEPYRKLDFVAEEKKIQKVNSNKHSHRDESSSNADFKIP